MAPSLFHRLPAALALACLAVASPTLADSAPVVDPARDARPALSLDDVLHMQTFGAVSLSPDGAWLIYERRRPYDAAPRFDRSHRSGWAISDLMVAKTTAGDPEPLLQDQDAGLLIGEWSPDSRRVLVHRLRGDRLEIGIVTIADRSVVWTGLTPDLVNGVTAAWLDDTRLALTIRPDGDLPLLLRFDGAGQMEMDSRWMRTAGGREPSRSRIETRAGRVTSDARAPDLQLLVLDIRSGERRVLAEGPVRDFAVSPDGRRIAVLMSGERAPRVPLDVVTQSAVQTRSRLSVIDVRTGTDAPADGPLDVAPHLLRWSDDGEGVLVWARRDGAAWSDARLTGVSIDGRTRQFETGDLLPFEAGRDVDELRFVRASWLGREAILRARTPGDDRFDWWRVGAGQPQRLTASLTAPPGRLSAVDGETALAFADGRLWSLGDPKGPKPLGSETDGVSDGQTYTLMTPSRVQANEPARRSWVAARSGTGTRILGAGGVSGVISSQTCAGILTGRAVARNAIATVCLDQGVETLALAAPGVDRVVDRLNSRLADVAIPQARPVRHRNPYGETVTSFLFLPPGLEPRDVKGLIIMVYPGVVEDGRYVEATGLQVLGPRAQLLASRGYAVLSAAVPDESRTTRLTMIDDFLRATDLAVDAALAWTPGLPSDRMALLGHSFGGYTALMLGTRPTRFRSIVAWAAPTDLAAQWGEARPHDWIWPESFNSLDWGIGAVENGQAMIGGPPWSDVEGYAAASPYMLADRISAPLLLITADRDYVPMANARRMLAAMHRQGKWARLVTYWGETHSNASPANVRDVYREIFDWLDRTLGEERLNPRPGDAPMFEHTPRSPRSS